MASNQPPQTISPEVAASLPLPKSKEFDPQELVAKQLATVQEQLESVKLVTVIVGSLVGATAAAIFRALVLAPWEEKKKAARAVKGNPTRRRR